MQYVMRTSLQKTVKKGQTQMEKPFKVAYVVRTKHGDLWKAIRDRGWTQKQAADFLKIDQRDMGRILNLNGRPPTFKNQKGGKKRLAHFKQGLFDLTGKTFEDLFPEEVYNDKVMAMAKPIDFFVEKDLATLKLEPSSDAMVLTLPEQSVTMLHYEEAVSLMKRVLTKREWQVIEARFLHGMTHEEIGVLVGGYSREWARQIERIAFHKLRKHKHILSTLRGDEDMELSATLGADGFSSLSQRAVSAPRT